MARCISQWQAETGLSHSGVVEEHSIAASASDTSTAGAASTWAGCKRYWGQFQQGEGATLKQHVGGILTASPGLFLRASRITSLPLVGHIVVLVFASCVVSVVPAAAARAGCLVSRCRKECSGRTK